ncbi:UDP-glucose iridoid glucosyltransferase-like [Heracleum sosnowskyi]|uniref:UDP-glucose iridoid glucosyltransferase-like n=1 Tax=Heracleum sosnowskyi TaxID=360622 RepID=A0AAD8M2K4_9APIA|nr:UDP-glucose iridoid glucosyltransferase-like [Heracleum sosnowskyi]
MKKQEDRKPHRLVLVLFPLQGHTTPMLQLGYALHSKGFAITIAHTRVNSPNPSNHPHFDFLPLSDDTHYSDKSGTPNIYDIESINLNCKAPLQEFLELQKTSHSQVDGIIHDSLMYFAATVANHVQIPNLVLRTSTAAFLQAYLALPRLFAEGYIPFQDSMLHELVPRLNPLRFKDLPVSRENMEDTMKFIEIARNFKSSSAMIMNTMDCLEQLPLFQLQQHFQVPLFGIGPLSKVASASSTSFLEEESSCIAWLNNQTAKSVLYVSKGSLAMSDEKEFTETAWGLANSEQPFLWVVRPGSVSGSDWTELLPRGFLEHVGERGLILKWAPQKEVLAHSAVGGFWTHCGWNSTMESLSEGVPMISSPQFFDQKVIARYITHVWKVGFELDGVLERGDVDKSIRRLMTGREGDEMRQRAIELKHMINVSILEGGSSYNSLNDLTEFLLTNKIQHN